MRRQINKICTNPPTITLFILIALLSASSAAQTAASPSTCAAKKLERQIVVSIPHRQLAVVAAGQVVKVYAVAVGADASPSPQGDFTITHRLVNPTYYHPGKVIGPGKSNPLGTRW